jgi:signal transduction histidine kinase
MAGQPAVGRLSDHRDPKQSFGGKHGFQPLFECEVQAIVIQQRDVNARTAAETERQHHIEELARSNLRLQEFASSAAHELRAPLQTISALTEVLVQRTGTDSHNDLLAQFIVDSAARMNVLIDRLIVFASATRE